MIAQRPGGSAPVVQAAAEALPFGDRRFDAALAVLTMQHWTDLRRGLAELRRVTARGVLMVASTATSQLWLRTRPELDCGHRLVIAAAVR